MYDASQYHQLVTSPNTLQRQQRETRGDVLFSFRDTRRHTTGQVMETTVWGAENRGYIKHFQQTPQK